jgi:hypothetical protein
MSELLIFIIGVFSGNVFGMLIMSLLCASKFGDLDSEIRDLRVQRQLLKEELLKPRAKPKPRKYRKRKNK